jgi:hypothetical protein
MTAAAPRARAVIAAYGCGEHLERTLVAWERARELAGVAAETVVVLPAGDPAQQPVARAAAGLGARVLEVAAGEVSTPGASRNRGAAGAQTEYLLFVDGDVELEAGFVARAIAYLDGHPEVGGFSGRLDECHWRAGMAVGGVRDLFHVGAGGEVPCLAAMWLCRRRAFEEIGGFDARLPAEEDFELSLRLRGRGWSLRAEPALAGTHHCGVRPTLAELRRRWANGMYTGQGLALRHAWATPRFAPVLARQWLYLAALAGLVVGTVALLAALAGRPGPLWRWLATLILAWLAMAVRKRSLRLGALSLATWGVQGVAIARTLLFGPWGRHAAAARPGAGGDSRGSGGGGPKGPVDQGARGAG